MSKIQLIDVARAAGVSKTTASLVLSGKGDSVGIRESTRQTILRQADLLGYLPHGQARSLRASAFGQILLLQGTRNRTNDGGLMLGIHESLEALDLGLLLARVPDESFDEPDRLASVLRTRNADGVLLNWASSIPPAVDRYLANTGIPFAWINAKRDFDSVHPDDRGAGARIGEDLISAGRRSVLWFGPRSGEGVGHASEKDREDGLREALEKGGGILRSLFHERNPESDDGILSDHRMEILARAIEEFPDLDALVAYDPVSMGSAVLALERAGKSVPDRVALAHFSNRPDVATGLAIRSERVPMRRMGNALVEMLVKKIGEGDRPLPSVTVPFTSFRGTTIPPKVSLDSP